MSWSAQVRGTEQLAPEMQLAVREGTQAGLEALGIKGAEMVQQNISTPYDGKPPAVCFGNLVGSVTSLFQPLPDGAREIIGVGTSLQADRYAAPVETGARPHMPPPSALLPWVQKKFGFENEKDALSMAFAVAKSIAKKGTQGHQMFSRALVELEPLAAPALEKEIAIAFARHGFTGVAA
jgi:hypothetical protein